MKSLLLGAAKGLGSFLFGENKTIEKTLEIVDKTIPDATEAMQTKKELILEYMRTDRKDTIPWVDALHKMGRQLGSFWIVWIYWESYKMGEPIPVQDLAVVGGPFLVYVLAKGKGK